MGLARLWVIPQGFSAKQGVFLRMPMEDLMRLVALESQRHRAVILGEDLGTLPFGFQDRLDQAGISGLRVMWFERRGSDFIPPEHWTPSAVAMTTTHDLPTVTGWWQGSDITWREKLHMAGDDEATRAADRAALWHAFRTSGATQAELPPAHDGEAVSNAAIAHLGRAASTLALLPIEDAIAVPDQPNLPGTIDEHPNWRRRLPYDAATLFARPDVAARLAILDTARKS
jgi:4-alpha-glucanotransferase